MADSPFSPVRIRMACPTSLMKIFPSPMRPVRAALAIASAAGLIRLGARRLPTNGARNVTAVVNGTLLSQA